MNASSQHRFFERLKSAGNGTGLAEKVSELLNISTDSAYRRIRGDTGLLYEEALILAQHYGIPISDNLRGDRTGVFFVPSRFGSGPEGLGGYLDRIEGLLEAFTRSDTATMLAAKDIPIFYFGAFPEIAAFKCRFWMENVLPGNKSTENYASLERRFARIHTLYAHINSTEIWNYQTIDSTLSQIQYYHQTGGFHDSNEVNDILQALLKLLELISTQARSGSKLINAKKEGTDCHYDLYLNETLLLDNSMFCTGTAEQLSVINYNAIQFLLTRDEDFCAEMDQWFAAIKSASSLISNTGDKERKKFFNQLRKRIAEVSY